MILVADPPASKICYIIHGVGKGPRPGAQGSAIKWKVYHTSVADVDVEIIEQNYTGNKMDCISFNQPEPGCHLKFYAPDADKVIF